MSLPHPASPEFRALATTLSVPVSDPPTVGEQLAVYRLARGVTQLDLLSAAGFADQGGTNMTIDNEIAGTKDEDRAYEERQRAIRAAEMAEDDAYEQRVREHLAGEQWDREQAERLRG